nr:SNF2-related protein [Ruthenibacterium lactatiformans]
MKDHARDKNTAAWLKQEYGDDLPAFPVPGAGTDLPWPKVQRRIAQLIKEDRFYTQEEHDNLDDIDPIAIREALAERGIVNGQVVDPEKLDNDPFIQQVMSDAERISQEEQPSAPEQPDLSGQPVTREGDTITIGSDPAAHEIDITVSDEEWQRIQEAIPDTAPPARDPLAPAYQVGDTVYLDDTAFVIENIGTFDVQLRDPAQRYPIFRSESKERFEMLLRRDSRNGPITEFLSADLEKADADMREVLTSALLIDRDKAYISGWFRSGEGNTHIEQRLSETFAGRAETTELITGETADYYTSTTGIEVDIQDKYNSRRSMSWREAVLVLRTLYQQELDGFSHEPMQQEPAHLEGVPIYQVGDAVTLPLADREISGTIGYIGELDVRIDTGPYSWSHETINRGQFEEHLRRDERNAHLFHPVLTEHAQPEITTETEAVYPGEKNGLPYDIVVERLHIEEPEPTPPAAENFRITDEHLGEGGPKQKFRANIMAIQLLKKCEEEHRTATPEEQKILSGYVGWGGLADAFDDSKASWATEYLELKTVLTPAEYASARASTLNAHYTSPTVIKAIYEAVEKMGFTAGNILEPACGVGNFFGLLPESMADSRLYGVELDSISGRIAKQLYPKADITVAGFETTDRRDFYDLAIGNVPFGQYKVSDRAYDKLGFSIHDYFFAKTLDQVRPGGVVAFITSRYTMDKQSPEVRRYIAERAELLGAIRLPNNAFKANAGTEVVSDILFLQKRDRPIVIEPDWVHLGENEDGFAINRYFLDHPEMVLGTPTSENTQYGRQDYTVAPIESLHLADQLHDAVKYIRGQYQEAELPELGEGEDIDTSIPADPNVKNYSYTVVDGEVYFRENSRMVKPDLNATAKERVKGLVELRECVQRLIDLQLGDADMVSIRMEQNRLNQLYDAFTDKYGLINNRGNALAFADDSSYYLLCSLEVLDEEGRLERKADMFTKRTIKQHTAVTSVDTASEALAVSISEKARVDMEYMSSLTGKDEQALAAELRGVVFLDFDLGPGGSQSYQTADEFLSGNVREKLRRYEKALETLAPDDPLYDAARANVEALKAAQPKDLDASEIDVRLGATWVDKNYIQEFMYELFDTPYHLKGSIKVNYSEFTAEWNITGKNAIAYNNVAAYTTYGTERANAYRILEDTLNLRDVRIYDTVEDPDGKERRVLNQKETTLAQQKQQAIKDAFRDWIWRDPERRQTLVQKYNEMFNATRLREYDGSHITFGGINPEIRLRPHQLNAIAHVLYGGNTLLAHEVGAGKTFEMVAAAMESKRLGLCQKSLFVVPNHLTEQWASEFLRLYPSANILVATKKDFETRNRKKFCSRIATGDYDAVIIGHSQFERIPVSAERQERLLQEQIWEIEDGLSELKASHAERFTIKQLEKTKKSLEARLDKLHKGERKDNVVTFEQLGVDRLFVDEAHSYKNLFLYTKMRNVAGISTTEAQKSSDMLLKCRYLDELTGGKGVVFATGTPVSNSMTELYTMMRYLQHDMLQRNRLTHFDNWASTFGETTTAIELAPEGTGYRARTRFAKFFNLPELMTIWKEAADIKTADQLNLPTPEVVYHNEVAQPTEHQQAMVQELSERAAEVHSGKVEPWQDNMLKITSDGRKLGLDQRILNPMLPDDPESKVNQCVRNILQIWRDGQADKLTQLVFCDISTPKAAPSKRVAKAAGGLDSPELRALEMLTEPGNAAPPFSVYDDIRSKLIASGIPAEEIAFIHDANTEARKKELFAKVRSGQVRVLMGSTFKMGAGMNVQDRLIALHDLDCPWRPGDLEQRKGRIVRQGNQNPTVHVYRYVTEGTFDSYLWQTVENKQKFISQIMTSKSPVRSCDDIDETALSYAEIKALCAGDPRIKEKMDLDIEVSRLKLLKANHQSQQYRLEDNLLKYFPEQIEQNKGYIAGFEKDMATLAAHQPPEGEFAGMLIRGDTLTDKDNAGAAILEACKEIKGTEAIEIGTYRGFTMSLSFEGFHHQLTLKGAMSYKVELGPDARGNLIRIDNALAGMPERLNAVRAQLDNLYQQQSAARAELGKPFPQEAELQQKSSRLAELNALLDMDGCKPAPQQVAKRLAKAERPSVLDKLKISPVRGTPDKSHKKVEMEVR